MAAAACLVALTGALGCGREAPAPSGPGGLERQALTVGLAVATSTYLPLYLAADDGLFEREGIKVELLPFRGGSDLIKALVAGSVDVGVASLAEVILGIDARQPVRAFYAGFNVAAFDWYAVPGIGSFAETKGRRFGVTRYGSSTDFVTRYALTANGLDPARDVRIVQGGDSPTRLAAMEAGQIDVNIFAAPEKFIAADRGYRLILSQRSLAADYPYHTFFATEPFIAAHPNALRALLRAHVRGVRLAKADRERSIRALVERLKMDPQYAARTYDDFIGDIHEDGRLPSDRGMEVFFEMGIRAGSYKERWPRDRYWVPTFADTYQQWKP
jgi:NitT/TauT family transport system substrate-binding protein